MTPLDRFVDILPVFIIFPVIYLIFKAIMDYYTRKKLIEKGLVGDEVKKFFETSPDRFFGSSLKWGLVLTFIGVAVVAMRLADEYIAAETAFGIMLIAAGLGLLLYYYLAGKKAGEPKGKTPIDTQ